MKLGQYETAEGTRFSTAQENCVWNPTKPSSIKDLDQPDRGRCMTAKDAGIRMSFSEELQPAKILSLIHI